jgi:hypothetical protein
VVDAQSLQSLYVKGAVIELASGAFIPVNALPLAKHLAGHDDSTISSHRLARKTETLIKVSGINHYVSWNKQGRPQLSEMMPLEHFYVNTSVRKLLS